MRTKHDSAYYRRIALNAIKGGYGTPISLTLTRINLAKDCADPVVRVLWGRPTGRNSIVSIPDDGTPYGIELVASCRRCNPCRSRRSKLWQRRAALEAAAGSRTWFGTLTLAPGWHSQLAGIEHASNNGDAGSTQSYALKAAQNYIKRLRKQAGSGSLRYMMVEESHKSGLPHIHMLLHERKAPIYKRTLEAHWPYGFSKWKLVEGNIADVARYVAKYVSKGRSRIRASRHYGHPMVLHSLSSHSEKCGSEEEIMTPPLPLKGSTDHTGHGMNSGGALNLEGKL